MRVGYNAAHSRVKKAKGKAGDHSCVDCGRTAEHWSYVGGDPNELVDERRYGLAYSLDVTRYVPRCSKCHKAIDGGLLKLTPEQVADIREARVRGEKIVSIATRLGIAKSTVSYHSRSILDALEVDNHRRGSAADNTNLTDADVLQIRQLYAAGGISQTELGRRYGLTQSAVSAIVRRRNWRHI